MGGGEGRQLAHHEFFVRLETGRIKRPLFFKAIIRIIDTIVRPCFVRIDANTN